MWFASSIKTRIIMKVIDSESNLSGQRRGWLNSSLDNSNDVTWIFHSLIFVDEVCHNRKTILNFETIYIWNCCFATDPTACVKISVAASDMREHASSSRTFAVSRNRGNSSENQKKMLQTPLLPAAESITLVRGSSGCNFLVSSLPAVGGEILIQKNSHQMLSLPTTDFQLRKVHRRV